MSDRPTGLIRHWKNSERNMPEGPLTRRNLNDAENGSNDNVRDAMRCLESVAVATVFIHASQDLMRGEPAALDIPASAFTASFLVYAALLSPMEEHGEAV